MRKEKNFLKSRGIGQTRHPAGKCIGWLGRLCALCVGAWGCGTSTWGPSAPSGMGTVLATYTKPSAHPPSEPTCLLDSGKSTQGVQFSVAGGVFRAKSAFRSQEEREKKTKTGLLVDLHFQLI